MELLNLEEGRSRGRVGVSQRVNRKQKRKVWNRGHVLKEKYDDDQRMHFAFYKDDAQSNLLLFAILFKESGHFYIFHEITSATISMDEKTAAATASYAILYDQQHRFELVARSCTFCDKKLGKYQCCSNTKIEEAAHPSGYRETLGHITHEMRNIAGAPGIRARHVSVSLPAYRKDLDLFDPWCPRSEHLRRSSDVATKAHLDTVIEQLKKEEAESKTRVPLTANADIVAVDRSATSLEEHVAYAQSLRDWVGANRSSRYNDGGTSGSINSESSRSSRSSRSNRDSTDHSRISSSDSKSSGGSTCSLSEEDDTLSDTASDSAESHASSEERVSGRKGERERESLECRTSWDEMNSSHRRASLELKRLLMDPIPAQKYVTNMPRWDARVESLVLQFQRNRVHMSSSKNVLLIDESSKSSACLQFGKASSGRFNLDWRGTISAVQAFAIGISTFQWSTKNRL